MGLSGKLRGVRGRLSGDYSRPLPDAFSSPLAGARALEIGGPSAVFAAGGLLPVYPLLEGVDGVQWSAETIWHSLDGGEGYRPEGTRRGELHVIDSIDLERLGDGAYDAVISSHVIEHIANPLRALAAWRRVSAPGGHVLMVAPHMSATFDHRRPLTPLSHVIEDRERDVGEDDLTHLEETLTRHDRDRDAEPGDERAWAERRRANATTRVLHHHTFTTPALLALLDHAGLELLCAETRRPHDIYVLGRWPAGDARADNDAFLAARHRSPFRADRRGGAG
jgi:SAM-dependent methyltransferase